MADDIVIPTLYTATISEGQNVGGTYNYFDDTDIQLIDGIIGDHIIGANLGNGNAYEWVGWYTNDPVINFTFDSVVTCDTPSSFNWF